MYSHIQADKLKASLVYDERFRCVRVRLEGATEDAYVPMEAIDSFVSDETVAVAREQESSSRKSSTR